MKISPLLNDLLWHLSLRLFAANSYRRARRALRSGASFAAVKRLLEAAQERKASAARALDSWGSRCLRAGQCRALREI
jgi:hypothetical protein